MRIYIVFLSYFLSFRLSKDNLFILYLTYGGVVSMFYTCNECHFTFTSVSTEKCPDCGSKQIRKANVVETKEALKYKTEFDKACETKSIMS